jgi:HK97 family phage major capsid protein
MAEIKEEIMQVLTQMRTEHKTAIEAATKSGEAMSAEAKANITKMNQKIDDLEFKLNKKELILPGEKGAKSEEQKARNAAFFKWVRGGKAAMEPAERKALVEDASGLILVPEDLEADVIRALPGLTVLRNLCTTRTTNRDRIRARSLTEVTVGWGKLETGALIPESTMVPTDANIYVEDLYGLTKVGEDELQDTDLNLQALISNSFSNAIATAEEAAFMVGAGHASQQPTGLTVDAVLNAGLVAGGGPANYITYGKFWATDDTVLLNDILAVEYLLPPQYLQGASWVMHRTTEAAVRVLQAAATGQYLWQPSLLVGQPNNIDGYPVYNNNSMAIPADTTTGLNILFGNFKQGYLILDRMGMSVQRLDELYAEAGLVGFKAHFRVGGAVIRPNAFRFCCNDAT